MSGKIGIIGSGMVGQALAKGFIKHSYEVMIGTNNKEKYAELREATGGRADVGPFSETAAYGDIIVLAVKGTAAEEALKSAGVDKLKGKTIIDATNPIADAAPVNGVLQYFTSPNDSLMERLQRLAPEARFVKAFSCVGNALMVNPDFGGPKPTMFICGNDDDAKKDVEGILDTFGWECEDMGSAEAARAIEPLAMLWCIPGFRENRWTHAFKLLKL
jgi:predicted dinucleotide-binding enzyme